MIGNDLTVTLAAEAGQLQLNAMEPVIVLNILQSMRMLMRGMVVLREKCIVGIEADRERCRELLEGSLVTVTALNPYIGYDEASRVAKLALAVTPHHPRRRARRRPDDRSPARRGLRAREPPRHHAALRPKGPSAAPPCGPAHPSACAISSSSIVTVIEQPAMSSEVT